MIELRLVTPHGDGFETRVEKVIVRGILGDRMLMTNTAPIVTPLDYGTMYVFSEGKKKVGVVHGGYVSMIDNVATVATSAFEWAQDIDATRARKAKARAEARLKEARIQGEDDRQSYKEAELSLLRAVNRLNHVEK